MSSRPPLGVPPRQARRGSSSTLGAQRPSHPPRPATQHYVPAPAPSGRKDALSGAAADAADGTPQPAAQGRHHASTPSRGGSKLRLELSNEWSNDFALVADSPQTLTPSRAVPAPLADSVTTDKNSPAPCRDAQPESDNPPLPMPKRHSQALGRRLAPPPPSSSSASAPPPPKKDSRPKPYTVETPPDAPRYDSAVKCESAIRDPFSKGLQSGYADFFPWTGRHHEDEWSSEAIQKGTWDRGVQNETASARSTAVPALKQKRNLQALSAMLTGAMNHRRLHAHILIPSTFKPPPRVTLTDTKREVWLKDLANPSIPLRRLSRTIPHGIRGPTLLDQCLNKNVPTERAIWLAKCVGANELRASTRKGAGGGAFALGGEYKWVREWTIFVEQFVEAAVFAFDEDDWKARATYAYAGPETKLSGAARLTLGDRIRLATNLYTELLLNRDHYLDWMMTGLENSPQSKLPMWILIAQTAWPDLVRSRRHGRRLVYSLLDHLTHIHNDPDRDLLIQCSHQLTGLLRTLLINNPESFVCPALWPKHRDALKALLTAGDAASRGAFQRVSGRNGRLLLTNTTLCPAGRHYLVKLLDAAIQGQQDRDLPARCLASTDDKVGLVRTVVEWATSVHRPGVAKVYVAARLIKSWTALDVQATSVVFDLLIDPRSSDRLRKKAVFHLVVELVRLGLFLVPKYLQWLIGRGGLHDAADIDPDDGPCASRLLVELPLDCLSESQKSQRSSLLRRAGHYSTADEASDISNALRCVDDTLGVSAHLGNADSTRKCLPLRKLLRRVSKSSKAVQSCIGAHLRQVLTPEFLGKLEPIAVLSTFRCVRAMLETTQDFSNLSHLLKAYSYVTDVNVLADSADTINFHVEVFLAIGSADALFDSLAARLKSRSREQGVAARPLLAALASLARRLPHREAVAKQLLGELAQSDRNNAIDACSPVSDSMALQPQHGEGEMSEQIDKLLASGNTVDPPTMNRLFRNIVPKLEAGWAKADGTLRVFAPLLARLRILDTQHFDKLMADWISHIGTLKERPRLCELLPLLVTLDCLCMSTLLHTASVGASAAEEQGASPAPPAAVYLQELLQLVIMKLPRAGRLSSAEAYRFEIRQKATRSEHPKAVLSLIRNALAEYGAIRARDPQRHCLLDDAACKAHLVEALRYLVVADSTAVANALSTGGLLPGAARLVRRIVTSLLRPGDDEDCSTPFDQVLGLSDELTMPFCQLKLNLDLGEAPGDGSTGHADSPSRFEDFAKAMDRAIEARNITWTSMMPCLSQDITRSLSAQAHSRFLDLMPSPRSASLSDDATSEHRIHLAENLLGVTEAIVAGQAASRCMQPTASLAEKLCDLWDIVASREEAKAEARTKVVAHWLPALLRFIVLHSASSEPAPRASAGQAGSAKAPMPAAHDARARIALVLCGLLIELDSQPAQVASALSPHVMDVAALLADGLSDDVRARCARSVLDPAGAAPSASASSDPRLYYIFSAQPPTWAENLRLAHKERAAAAAAASSVAHSVSARGVSALFGLGPAARERLSPYVLRRWEVLSEPTPNVGDNDTSLSLGLFEAIKMR